MRRRPDCHTCQRPMKKAMRSSAGIGRQMTAVGLVVLGVAACFTVVGICPGLAVAALGATLAGRQQRVWQCKRCRYYLPR